MDPGNEARYKSTQEMTKTLADEISGAQASGSSIQAKDERRRIIAPFKASSKKEASTNLLRMLLFPEATRQWHKILEDEAVDKGNDATHKHPPCPYCHGVNIYPAGGGTLPEKEVRHHGADVRKLRL